MLLALHKQQYIFFLGGGGFYVTLNDRNALLKNDEDGWGSLDNQIMLHVSIIAMCFVL